MRIKLDLSDYEAFEEWWGKIGRDKVTKELGRKALFTVHWAFKNQGKRGEWPARLAPNVAGIIRRVNRQEDPKDTDFIDMPALFDSGKLRNSFKVITPTFNKSTVGWTEVRSSVPWADRMQRGLVDRLKLSPIGRRHLAIWLATLPKDVRRLYREDIGWMLNKKKKNKSYKIRPHKRVMLALDAMDRADLGEYVLKTISDFKSKPQYKDVVSFTTKRKSRLGKNVVGFEESGRVSYFGPKKTRGKTIYKLTRRVRVRETQSAFGGGRDKYMVWNPNDIRKKFPENRLRGPMSAAPRGEIPTDTTRLTFSEPQQHHRVSFPDIKVMGPKRGIEGYELWADPWVRRP